VTGDVLNDETVHFFMQSGARYIQKPFSMGELMTAAEQVLNRSQRLSS
jgi:DNA-binding response OmpR family regulator